MTKKVFVMSGKGGVGKTTVAVNVAAALAANGYETGLLDLDLHGPDVGRMLGGGIIPSLFFEGKIAPVVFGDTLKVFSLSMVLQEGAPVAWRGPLKHRVLEEICSKVDWGEIDFLVCDLPPGTGDEVISAFQILDPDGVLVVSTPQEVAIDDVRRAVNFVKKMGKEVIGFVENMSYFVCPHCGQKSFPFGEGGVDKLSEEFGVPVIARIPMDPDIVALSDSGRPAVLYKKGSILEEEINKILERLLTL